MTSPDAASESTGLALLGGSPVRAGGPPGWPVARPDVVEAIHRAAEAGAWANYVGPCTEDLRSLLREFHGVEHVWLCSSGTAAVEIGLRALGVAPGDEVVLAAYDFKANFSDVVALGAVPVLVDLRPDDWQLDVEKVPEALTPKTKAVIASHLHGGFVDVDGLRRVLAGRSIGLLEDACQCPGAILNGRRAGTLGDIGVLSFGGSKLTAAGRGGALLTNNEHLLERIRRHTMRGNDLSPLSELQAAALPPQWRTLDADNRRRAENVRRLAACLADFSGLRMIAPPPSEEASSLPSFYKVGFEYRAEAVGGLSRELFCRAMRAEGIGLFAGFRGLHRIHGSKRFRAAGPLSTGDAADERVVVLHHPVLLETSDEIEEIAMAAHKIRNLAAELMARQSELPAMTDESDDR